MRRLMRKVIIVLVALMINAIGVLLLTKISTRPERVTPKAPVERRVDAPQIQQRPEMPKPKRRERPRATETKAAVEPSQLPKFSTLTAPRAMQVVMDPALNQSLNTLFSDLSRRPVKGARDQQLFDGSDSAREVDRPLDASAVEQAPVVRSRVPLRYPLGAERAGVTGYVVLRGLIERDGSVSRVDILKSSPRGVFDDAARGAFGRWRFEPGRDGGKPVRVWVRKRLEFQLR